MPAVGISTKPSPSKAKLVSKAPITTSAPKSRPQKLAQSVNTNVSSYDRTDPFLAFNVLLKLLGSLPSRIGGCQFKLTPDEHKLSLHLLTIVEPFVGLAPSRRTITRQPTEVLDAIVFHVEEKKDLIALALSCHRMRDVVFPRHFEYREIKCKVSSISVWNHLITNRALARNVRRFEIMDERSTEEEIVPKGILQTDTDLESTDDELGLHDKQERYLVAALTKMVGLTTFSWSCNHSPISIDNIWPTLLKVRSLRQVDIKDNLMFSTYESESTADNRRKPVSLYHMRTVTLHSTIHTYGSSKHPVLSRALGMLSHCPSLTSLDIGYTTPRSIPNTLTSRPAADEFFLSSRWPYLTSLVLTNLRCAVHTGLDTAAAFLFAHQNLEVLHFDVAIGSLGPTNSLVLPRNSLPRLRELHANKDIANAILECPSEAPRPLETLKGFRLAGTHAQRDPDATFLRNLKQCGRSIKRIELTGWNEMEDVRRLIECAPGLTWLDVGKKANSQTSRDINRDTGPAPLVAEWAALLGELPELVAFHGVRFFYKVSSQAVAAASAAVSSMMSTPSTGNLNNTNAAGITGTNGLSMIDRSRVKKNDTTAAVLAWRCPKLRRTDHWDEDGGKIIVLVKDVAERGKEKKEGDKDKDGQVKMAVKWEVRRVKA